MGVPCLILRVSGSKSQPGSGVPPPASANSSWRVVKAPMVMFLQKSGPRPGFSLALGSALKVVGSHSSRATICTGVGGLFCAAPLNGQMRKAAIMLSVYQFIFCFVDSREILLFIVFSLQMIVSLPLKTTTRALRSCDGEGTRRASVRVFVSP